MQNIVFKENGEAKVSITDVADYSGNEERSIMRLIKKHRTDLEYFGSLSHFKDGDLKSTSLKLSEPQTTLLFTHMRSNPIVDNFKFELVKQFYKMRETIVNELCNTHEKKELKLENKLEAKDKHIKKLSESIYAKVRGKGFETAHRIIAIKEADISTSDFNKLLLQEGLISEEEIKRFEYIAVGPDSLMDGNAIVIHVDSAVKVLDKYGIKQKIDSQLVFDYE